MIALDKYEVETEGIGLAFHFNLFHFISFHTVKYVRYDSVCGVQMEEMRGCGTASPRPLPPTLPRPPHDEAHFNYLLLNKT